MQSPLSVNIKPYYCRDWIGCLTFLRDLDPATVVVSVDQLDHLNRIMEVQQLLPNAVIVARFIDEIHDGNMHLKPEKTGDTNKYIVSPTNFLNRLKSYGTNGRSLYYFNEPSGEVSGDGIQRLIDHATETMDLAASSDYNMSLTVMNWGVGHPMLTPDGLQLDARFDRFFQRLSQYRNRHIYGLHLYSPADLQGRLNALKRTHDRLGLMMPRIVVSEFGFDTSGAGDQRNGFKSRGMDGETFANWEVSTFKSVYKPWVENGTIIGLATFIYGHYASWANYDVETNASGETSTAWRDAILKAKRAGELDVQKIAPSLKTKDIIYGELYRLALGGKIITAYVAPSITDRPVGTIPDNSVVEALNVVTVDRATWLQIKYPTLTAIGWINIDLVSMRQTVEIPVVRLDTSVEVPAVKPQEAPTTVLDANKPVVSDIAETPQIPLKIENKGYYPTQVQIKVLEAWRDELTAKLEIVNSMLSSVQVKESINVQST